MNPELITMERFFTLFKRQFSINYNHWVVLKPWMGERKIQRWRKENNYRDPYDEHYVTLFTWLETECSRLGYDKVNVLVKGFSLPDEYLSKTYEELKAIIIASLDYNYINRKNKGNTNNNSLNIHSKAPTQFFTMREYIQSCLKQDKKIKKISMSFHSGFNWTKDNRNLSLLRNLIAQEIILEVIINPDKVIHDIASSMRTAKQKAGDINNHDTAIFLWNTSFNPKGNLTVKISNYPIFRKICIVHYEDESSEALVREYAYNFQEDFYKAHRHFLNEDFFFTIYKNEFEYLWNNAMTYQQWMSLQFTNIE